eukprot:CAMPEP_0181415082 /NCGR_PEP_ID=MMETSP1110-20121109/9833_1 /TAXON_ID=174948 /ORGANISM="Symbiodinium sp., Strain CCMP421" /LENGTH=83 /DNA_ID=CAMNT_0023537973 /DNA_START=270 /DNA_END=521 /DNA_ORIENTATION=+
MSKNSKSEEDDEDKSRCIAPLIARAASRRVSFLPLLLLSSDVPELVLTRAATESAEFLDPREPFDSTCVSAVNGGVRVADVDE